MTCCTSGMRAHKLWRILLPIALLAVTVGAGSHHDNQTAMRFVQIEAKTKQERSAIADSGVSIEAVRTDSVWGIAHPGAIQRVKDAGFQILGDFPIEVARGGHENAFGFPPEDSRFHTYDQLTAKLNNLASKHADIAKLRSIGKTIEGRDVWALQINSTPESLMEGTSGKPGAVYMGTHHAREHLSLEVPLMLAEHILANREDMRIARLIDTRDIWIIPMVNPDGAEWDISTGRYKWWRKNRRNNGDGTFGVDLNRNYSFKWGTGGSDKDTSSDVYMGKAPFSEPESQAVRDFVASRANIKVLLSFHSFSELVLYPWGHTYDSVGSARDLAVFEKMAKTMAKWNKYKSQQTSDLYIASGDTTDWAYGEKGIFAFTFELSPRDSWSGGFYPGARIIDRVFQDNLQPCLYMMEVADDPYRTVDSAPSRWLQNYVEPRLPVEAFLER